MDMLKVIMDPITHKRRIVTMARPKTTKPKLSIWDKLMVLERRMSLSGMNVPKMPDGTSIKDTGLITDLQGAVWWVSIDRFKFWRVG